MKAWADGSAAGAAAHAAALRLAARAARGLDGPLAATTPFTLDRAFDMDVGPRRGAGLEATMDLVRDRIVRNSVDVTHPLCAAHLHCPPLLASLAAEAVVSATNQSLDSWDQGPAATHLEGRMIEWLAEQYGLGPRADGVFTSGGTQSNLMGLLLARDHAAMRAGCSIVHDGVTDVVRRFRVLCSSATHFSVRKSARILGLGEQAVVELPADRHGRLDPAQVDVAMASMRDASLIPMAVVATAGTTDLGAIDPLDALAEVARRHGAWIHVDAAVGGALVLSEREAHRLRGIEAADSVTVDFHKLWFQPISCGAFLVRESDALEPVLLHADYLNPDEEELPSLVGKSLQTTRRFDALKLFVTLQTHGRDFLARAVETTIDLAAEAARLVDEHPLLELARRPSLNTVLFRYRAGAPDDLDEINDGIRRTLLQSGSAVVGRTRLDGRVFLKLTLMNPTTTPGDLRELLALVAAPARAREPLAA